MNFIGKKLNTLQRIYKTILVLLNDLFLCLSITTVFFAGFFDDPKF